MPIGGGNCNACHGDWFPNHLVGDHQTEGSVNVLGTSSNCTTTCHTSNTAATVVSITHTDDCTNCHTNTTWNGSLRAGAGGNGTALLHTIDSVSTCVSCHINGAAGNGNDYNAHFVSAHDSGVANPHRDKTGTVETLVGSATCTTNCHPGGAINAANIILAVHKITCENCHTNQNDNGTLRVGANNNGDASGHTLDSQSSCIDCHGGAPYNYNTQFETAHDVKDHTGMATLTSCTTNCHTSSTPATIISTTHKNTCVNCHSNTTTDGRLVNGGANAGSYGGTAANRGDATQGSGDCANCHGATGGYNYDSLFQAAHQVKDHTGMATQASCTSGPINCHNTSTTPATIISNGHNSNCVDCHSNTTTDGRLVDGSANAGSFGGTTLNRGDATGGAEACSTCHGSHNSSWYYHGSGVTPDHTSGGFNAVLWPAAPANVPENCGNANCHDSGSNDRITIVHNLASAAHPAQCNKCHTSTGALQADGTNGNASRGAGDCANCHSTGSNHDYFNDHNHHASANQLVYVPADDVSQNSDVTANECAKCHNDKTGTQPLLLPTLKVSGTSMM